MTPQQLAILNSLVTFAAEHIPGGLSIDEREVAKIVGQWALKGEIPQDRLAHLAYGDKAGMARVCYCALQASHPGPGL